MYEVFGAGAPFLTVLLLTISNYQLNSQAETGEKRLGHSHCEV